MYVHDALSSFYLIFIIIFFLGTAASLRLLSYQEEHMKRACDDLHSLLYTARSIEVSLRHFHFSDTIHKVFRPLLLELQRVMEPGLVSFED